MIKLVTLMRRKPGLSKADFIAYYEAHHRLIGETVLAGYASRYVRRYLEASHDKGRPDDPDVVMEIWFPDQAAYDACFARMAQPALREDINADEDRLFDRGAMRSFIVRECESVLPPLA